MASSKHVDLRKMEKSERAIFREYLIFLNKKSSVFKIKKSNDLGRIKPRLSL